MIFSAILSDSATLETLSDQEAMLSDVVHVAFGEEKVPATIDARPGTVYEDVVDALDQAIFAGFNDITYELGALIVLTMVYFAIGVWIFNRRHMRAH